MANNEELLRKYELAKSDTYKSIREESLNYIVKCANSAHTQDKIQGMLLLIGHIDGWVNAYEAALANRKEN